MQTNRHCPEHPYRSVSLALHPSARFRLINADLKLTGNLAFELIPVDSFRLVELESIQCGDQNITALGVSRP